MIMMRTAILSAAALMAMCAVLPSAHAHTSFQAEIATPEAPTSFIGYTHSGIFYYNLTSPTPVAGTTAAIVKTSTNETAVTLMSPVKPDSTNVAPDSSPPTFGEFGPADIAPQITPQVYGGVYDLFQLACKNDISIVIKAKNKVYSAPIKYAPSDEGGPVKMCEEATQPYKPPAPSPSPAPSNGLRTEASFVVAALLSLFGTVLIN